MMLIPRENLIIIFLTARYMLMLEKITKKEGDNRRRKGKKIFHLVVMSERGKLLEAYRGLYSGKYCIRTTISFESFFL